MPTPTTPPPVLIYDSAPLDRADPLRRDPAALDALFARPDTLAVIHWHSLVPIRQAPDRRAVLVPVHEVPHLAAGARERLFLGTYPGGPAVFALDVTPEGSTETDDRPDLEADLGLPAGLAAGARLQSLRAAAAVLPAAEASILATARALVLWHARNRFCNACGGAVATRHGGWAKQCTNAGCATLHFPRTDPAVIMAVTHGDRVLLSRQANWPEAMCSVIAGYVEPGESLEQAVKRETREEVGIEVTDVTYVASQPWPFPASLMVGFTARALSDALKVDTHELEDAFWETRAGLRAYGEVGDRLDGPGAPQHLLPRRDSIARYLLMRWLAEGD